ncbi:Rpn family recombination-promoting nuclease/putative transposase [Oceanobacillus sp. FSL W7-1281]|uniref:Rpn family recombination-promoting nuclease/putative transposase n=1 Tax=Oceanobacillus sp. FSL W7-1281 TaxID=2921698 RepID=UPI0030DB395D
MDLKVDYAFKQLFGNEKNKDITVVFLNAILAKSGRSPIQQLYFQNIEIGGEYEEDKKSRLDLLTRTENKEWVNIEIQINNEYNMIKRLLYYWSRLFSEQLKEGQSYKELYPVISINIMHFNLLDETDAFYNIFRLYEMKQKNRKKKWKNRRKRQKSRRKRRKSKEKKRNEKGLKQSPH